MTEDRATYNVPGKELIPLNPIAVGIIAHLKSKGFDVPDEMRDELAIAIAPVSGMIVEIGDQNRRMKAALNRFIGNRYFCIF